MEVYPNSACASRNMVTSFVKDSGGSGGSPQNLLPFQMRWGIDFGCAELSLPLLLICPNWWAILLGSSMCPLVVKTWDTCFVVHIFNLLADLFLCPINPQLKHANLAARQPFWFIDPLRCEVLPHPLQGLMDCGVGKILTFWDCHLQSDLCTLDNITGCIVLWR